MRRAFTLIELLITLAAIVVLAAILFPVIAAARGTAAATAAMSDMHQLGLATSMYASETDGRFAPSTNYDVSKSAPERLWPNLLRAYCPSKEAFVAPLSDGTFPRGWSDRTRMTFGMNSATAIDQNGCREGRDDSTGCAAFRGAATFEKADHPESVAMLAATPGGLEKDRYDGHEFNPYNGPILNGDVDASPPLCADRDLVKESTLPMDLLKPIFARYGTDGHGAGKTPIGFADGHAKSFSAKSIQAGKAGISWRFR